MSYFRNGHWVMTGALRLELSPPTSEQDMEAITRHLNDPASVPPFFGFFEDFLTGEVVDGSLGAPVTTFSGNIGTTFAGYSAAPAAAVAGATATWAACLNAGNFMFTPISSGTVAVNEAGGGWVRLSGAATTDDSGGSLQGRAAFNLATGKTVSFKARVQLGEATSTNIATESDLFIGLALTDRTVIAGVTDGIYFLKADGGTTITCNILSTQGSGSTSVTLSAAQFTADTNVHTFGIGITAKGTNNSECIVEFSIDGVVVYRNASVQAPASTVILAPTIGFQTGDNTGTKRVDVDYVGVSQAR